MKKSKGKEILNFLKQTKLLNDLTDEEKFIRGIEAGKGVYIGFDPTANSLHLGNYMQLRMLEIFSNFGVPVVAVIGGATGQIGDPSGKKQERTLLDFETVQKNLRAIESQIKHHVPNVKIVNNADFYDKLSIFDFFREVGKFINVSYLNAKESISQRIDTGLSYTEYSYPLIQAYDFYCLYTKHNISIQMGGSDQWGNITTGIELIRRKTGQSATELLASGITVPLLLNKNGTKFGKSEKGALYLDASLTSPFQMYQYLYNLDNDQAEELIYKFLDLKQPVDKTGAAWAQKYLASELVKKIHGQKIWNEVDGLNNLLFTNDITKINERQWTMLEQNADFFSLKITDASESVVSLVSKIEKSSGDENGNGEKFISSGSEVRRIIQQGGIFINGQKVSDPNSKLSQYKLSSENTSRFLIKKGKRDFALIFSYKNTV